MSNISKDSKINTIKSVFIQNLISPYRANFFNELSHYDSSFGVYYLGEKEADRNWDLSKIPMKHPYWIDRFGLYTIIRHFHIHVNPLLVTKVLISRKIKNIILCVSYNDLNIVAIALAKRFHLTNKKLFFWAEANYLTNGARKKESFLKKHLRAFVFKSVDGAMIIPGTMAKITFQKWNIPIRNIIYLPNTINDQDLLYLSNNNRDNNILPHFIIPVRLIESLKGVLNFFDAIGLDNIRKARFIIAGEGEDRIIYEQYIDNYGLHDHIKLVGFCESRQMMEFYNNSNAFLLPSFSDPSPLTLVEALKFHLPILCSSHCGNHFEVVKDGVNGYTFSPLDKIDIRSKFETLIQRRNEWKAMGEESAIIYKEVFETKKVIRNFINQFSIFDLEDNL
ncbi:glycosyltransferase [Parabacteroides merdae]|uniref:glycosyltransferase n=1 Tax=Parabacteroides merdae TaxID=46503 RepID=UPI0022E849C5|nr:glycosyltransferase [Parabacteroides merdae]